MPPDKHKILLTIDQDLLERIEDFRFTNRMSSRSKAIRSLIEEALTRDAKKSNRKKGVAR
jgi:metal-responsive CopG/Arc/MetJ family transcriptional regulator